MRGPTIQTLTVRAAPQLIARRAGQGDLVVRFLGEYYAREIAVQFFGDERLRD